MQNDSSPLVSIGIPTYNRAKYLSQTVQSAINQSYGNVEIIISDNASTDNTAELCEKFCSEHSNIRYYSHGLNQGSTFNFNSLLNNAKGEYFMWLGDDDWIDENYVRDCMELITSCSGISVVAGQAKYYGNNDAYLYTGLIMNLDCISAYQRILKYFSEVKHNGIFYGIMPMQLLRNMRLSNVMGGDLLLMASLASLGKMYTITTCSLHRRRGGVSSNSKEMAKTMSLPLIDYYFPRISVAKNVFLHIIREQSFASIPIAARYLLATRCIALAFKRKLLSLFFKSMFIEQSAGSRR